VALLLEHEISQAKTGKSSVYAVFAGLIFVTYRNVTAPEETFSAQKNFKASTLSNSTGPTLKLMF